MTTASDKAADIATRCEQAKLNAAGTEWSARCPSHDDQQASLSIGWDTDHVLIHCHVGCDTRDIVHTLGYTMGDLFLNPKRQVKAKRTIVAVYPYCDLSGQVVHETVRYAPKSFSQRRPDPANPGGHIWDLDGVTLILYALPLLPKAIAQQDVIYFVEGEKAAEALLSLGLPATCSPLGAGKWRDAYADTLRGAYVCILPDNDPSGQKHAATVAGSLHGIAAGVKILDLPGLPPKGDAFDWKVAGGTKEELETLRAAAPLWAPASAQPAAPASSEITFIEQKNGKPRPVLFNVLQVLSKDAHWKGVFGYDLLADIAVLLQRPPYLAADDQPWEVRPVTDYDDSETTNWVQDQYEVCAPTAIVAEAIQVMAKRNAFHVVREYLNGLAWDGISRLDTWLTTYAHAKDDSEYTRAVAKNTLIGAVARVMDPGCKADAVTVLENDQGTLKSTLWRVLASDAWFSDSLTDLHSKDAAQSLRGKWIIELGELAALGRSEVEAVKRFISATQDHYRASYGRRAQTTKRQNVFVGSTNKDTYLKDETGNRRFWPIKLTGRCDIDALQEDRDQLWAEAVARYRRGETWYMPAHLEKIAAQEQEERYEEDPWAEIVLDFVDGFNKDDVTTKEIFLVPLRLDPQHWTSANGKRIGAILRAHGWRYQTIRDDNGKAVKGFKRVTLVTVDAPEGLQNKPNENNDVTLVTVVTPPARIIDKETSAPELFDTGEGEEGKEEVSSTNIYGGNGYNGYTVTNFPQVTPVSSLRCPVCDASSPIVGATGNCICRACPHTWRVAPSHVSS